MKIAIVGCGAMGSVYAGLFATAGHHVWAIDSWAAHVDAIRERGLRVEGASGDRTVRIDATTDPADAGPCDLVVIATKASGVGAAAAAAEALLGPDTIVLTIQNGLGSADAAAAVLGRERLAIGVVGGFGASVVAPGHVHHNGWELVRLGEMEGPATARLRRVAALWQEAGFRVRTFDDIHQMVWEKLICNTTFSGPCAILERTIGEVMADPDAWPVARGCAREAFVVARAKGIAIGFDDVDGYVRAFGETIPGARPSVLLDHVAGRRSEIEVINGAVPREGRAAGIATPVNETVVALVMAKERRMGVR
ncbi:MAG: 2-dehydropantoate 2-reductase [Acetobacterales bacterium]